MLATQFLYLFYLCNVISVTLEETTNEMEKEIRLLDQIDNSQVVQSLVMTVDQVLNDYIKDQISVESSSIRAVIWNTIPSDAMIEPYFNKHFKVIKYDMTYRDLFMKKLDYTRQDLFSNGITWEKFIYVPDPNGSITLFFSYTMKWSIFYYLPFMRPDPTAASKIEKFCTEVSIRMFNKLTHPTKSVHSHGMSLVNNENTVQYFFVYHDNAKGYIERMILTYEDGLKEQAETDKQKLSSCILMIKNGQKSLHSIHHPIIPGFVEPDFHAYYVMLIPKQRSTIHRDL